MIRAELVAKRLMNHPSTHKELMEFYKVDSTTVTQVVYRIRNSHRYDFSEVDGVMSVSAIRPPKRGLPPKLFMAGTKLDIDQSLERAPYYKR